MKNFFRNRRPKHLWRWVALGITLFILVAALFFYLRISSFVDSTFGGRNEVSLLTASPSPESTASTTPAVTSSLTLAATVPVATPLPPESTSAIISPALTPPVSSPTTVTPTTTFNATSTATSTPGPTSTRQASPSPEAQPSPGIDPALLPLVQKIKQGQKTTGLFIGYGGKNHDGPYLTDTIMLVTYNPAKNLISMVNIPRDLYVLIPYAGPDKGFMGKINSAFAYIMQVPGVDGLSPRYRFQPNNPASRVDAAANLLKDVVEKVSGSRIDFWAAFDFTGFIKMVDTVGGVDITVDTAFDDYLYPAHDDPNKAYAVTHIHFDAGPQHLNGERALQYVRSRQSAQDGNDFNRSKRQMKMVQALKDRLNRPDILPNALGIMEALQGNFRTSLAFSEVTGLYGYYKGEGAALTNNLHFNSHILSTDNLLVSGMSPQGSFILYPAAGQTNYTAIQAWLTQIEREEAADGTG